jgi:hypothetical protein
MSRVVAKLDITSFWHAGTGRGAGTDLDARTHRSPAGLPMLPGRSVRGLFREALRTAVGLGLVSVPDAEVRCFGSSLEPPTHAPHDIVGHFEESRFRTRPGVLVFGNARLGSSPEEADGWERWAATTEGRLRVEHLFRPFASTKLDERGVADDHTLRAIELVVPVVLVAELSLLQPVDFDWLEMLRTAAPFLRGVGSHRNRGLGRTTTTVEVLS